MDFACLFLKKPDKYGLKLFALVDVQFPYADNLEVYVGTKSIGPYQSSNKVPDIVIYYLFVTWVAKLLWKLGFPAFHYF